MLSGNQNDEFRFCYTINTGECCLNLALTDPDAEQLPASIQSLDGFSGTCLKGPLVVKGDKFKCESDCYSEATLTLTSSDDGLSYERTDEAGLTISSSTSAPTPPPTGMPTPAPTKASSRRLKLDDETESSDSMKSRMDEARSKPEIVLNMTAGKSWAHSAAKYAGRLGDEVYNFYNITNAGTGPLCNVTLTDHTNKDCSHYFGPGCLLNGQTFDHSCKINIPEGGQISNATAEGSSIPSSSDGYWNHRVLT